MQKFELIVITSKVALESIENNLESISSIKTIYANLDTDKLLKSLKKIDLVVMDEVINCDLKHVKTIVHVTDNKNDMIREDEIKVYKPFKLERLLDIIYENRAKEKLFCCINSNIIYDEQEGILFNKDLRIKFTEKENEVFKYLLLAEDNKINKSELLKDVWGYHQDTDSTTIETHLYRLKQKLPFEILQIKDNSYKLMISEII